MNDYHKTKKQYKQTLQEKHDLFNQLRTKFPDIDSKEIYLKAKQAKGKLDPEDLAKINTIHRDPLYQQAMTKHNETQKLKKQLESIPKPPWNSFKRDDKNSSSQASDSSTTYKTQSKDKPSSFKKNEVNSKKKKGNSFTREVAKDTEKIKPTNFFLESGKLRPRRALAAGAAGLALGGALLYNDYKSGKQ